MKQNLAVFFGGRTVEHDVSIITGNQLMDNADPSKYNVIPVYIARDGIWYTGEKLRDVNFYKNFDATNKTLKQVALLPTANRAELVEVNPKGGLFAANKRAPIKVDVAIPAMHGLHGEDGTLQGLFELANIPYASAGVVGSAVGMDKIVMKAAFKGNGFPVLDSTSFERTRWVQDPESVLDAIEGQLVYPLFVKPANLGSSIGINKAVDRESLRQAIDVAIAYDRRILVENGVSDLIEINCSCLGFGGRVRASVCEQPVTWKEFLTFEEKYMRGEGASKSMESMARKIPAPIGEALTKQIQDLACAAFTALDCKGVVRIDFIYDTAAQKAYINEINTIPGSFAFYLWEPTGLPYAQLIDELVEIAKAAHAEKNASSYAFDSGVLNKAGRGAKGAKGAKA